MNKIVILLVLVGIGSCTELRSRCYKEICVNLCPGTMMMCYTAKTCRQDKDCKPRYKCENSCFPSTYVNNIAPDDYGQLITA